MRATCLLSTTLLIGFLTVGSTTVSAREAEERYKWWQSPTVKVEVGLTEDQSQQLEAIFQAMLPRMKADKEELDRLESGLSRLMAEATVEESALSQEIDRVEAARARASKTRLIMLYRMHRLLAPDQRQKLEVMYQRMKQERHGRGGSRDE